MLFRTDVFVGFFSLYFWKITKKVMRTISLEKLGAITGESFLVLFYRYLNIMGILLFLKLWVLFNFGSCKQCLLAQSAGPFPKLTRYRNQVAQKS